MPPVQVEWDLDGGDAETEGVTLSEMSGARFSPDRAYRPILWRRWDAFLPWLNAIMLNPSKAGAVESDPTVTRQICRAKVLGCGGLMVTNAYDLVATDPRDLLKHPKPLSDECNKEIIIAADAAFHSGGYIMCGWGKHISMDRQTEIKRLLAGLKIHCLGLNENGTPVHPLYKSYSTPLMEFAE